MAKKETPVGLPAADADGWDEQGFNSWQPWKDGFTGSDPLVGVYQGHEERQGDDGPYNVHKVYEPATDTLWGVSGASVDSKLMSENGPGYPVGNPVKFSYAGDVTLDSGRTMRQIRVWTRGI